MEPRSCEETGKICLFSVLKGKEVISVADGKRLGQITDAEIDIDARRITAIILPQEGGRSLFFEQAEEWYIPWEMIERIGEDVVLVKAAMQSSKKEKRSLRLFAKRE